MGICFVGISNQLFIRGSDKNKVVTGKTSFFVIGAFCAHHFICLNIWLLIWQFCMEVMRFQSQWFQLKNGTPVLLKNVFVFQKICFKVKVLKTFKIFIDCHIKTYQSLKRKAILKIPSTVFYKILCSFRWLQNEIFKKKCLIQKPT